MLAQLLLCQHYEPAGIVNAPPLPATLTELKAEDCMLPKNGTGALDVITDDELVTEELPFDFAEYLAQRLSLSLRDAVSVLGHWVLAYEPSPRAVSALRTTFRETAPESRRAA
jgi:hypothetical protein